MSRVVRCPGCRFDMLRITGHVDAQTAEQVFRCDRCGHRVDRDFAHRAYRDGVQVSVPAVTGATLIGAERERQRVVEGYTADHDADHATDLHWGAWCYLDQVVSGSLDDPEPPKMWPWPGDWKPGKTAIRALTIAGALIAAEIDRRLAQGERP